MGKFYEGLGDQLSLYVRQSAWLNTGRIKQTKKGQERLPARIDEMKANGQEAEMPPNDAPHLTEYFFDAGAVMNLGGGQAPISSAELVAWQQGRGITLSPWEFSLLRRLSRDYLNQYFASQDPSEPAPYISRASIEANRKAVNRRISNEMRSISLAQQHSRKK